MVVEKLPVSAADLLNLELSPSRNIHFPLEREVLMALFHEDIVDRSTLPVPPGDTEWQALKGRDEQRSETLSSIVEKIISPSVANIDADGSRAVWLITQHSPTRLIGIMLNKYKNAYFRDHRTVFHQGIPFMADRLRVLTSQPQIYGTQHYLNSENQVNLYPVWGFESVNARRKLYGLGNLEEKANGNWPDKEDFLDFEV